LLSLQRANALRAHAREANRRKLLGELWSAVPIAAPALHWLGASIAACRKRSPLARPMWLRLRLEHLLDHALCRLRHKPRAHRPKETCEGRSLRRDK
jgi:hypothetical protein